jgi:hypothetical protein
MFIWLKSFIAVVKSYSYVAFSLALFSAFIVTSVLSKKIDKLEANLKSCEKDKILLEYKAKYEAKALKRKLDLVVVKKKVSEDTVEYIDKKEEEGKDYEILYANKNQELNKSKLAECGCKFDGIGWVFK